jgi:hypothetical protein
MINSPIMIHALVIAKDISSARLMIADGDRLPESQVATVYLKVVNRATQATTAQLTFTGSTAWAASVQVGQQRGSLCTLWCA